MAFSRQSISPLFWASLRKERSCIGIPQKFLEKNSCSYLGTPLEGDITWQCTAGSYCLGPDDPRPCPPGFYCPPNTIEAGYCPQGYFCSNDTTLISVCPAGKFCPLGTVTPKSCGYILASCPEGSYDAPKFVLLLVFALVALGIYFVYKWKVKADALHQLKKKQKYSANSQMTRIEEKPDVQRLEKTFDIKFDELGLKLPNGVEIMKGVSGVLQAGRTCAIMGPSGSGKTTFVTLLTGKQPRTSGTVMINGKPDELSRYSKLIGYVPQEDIMLRELKVREILTHSARMRLPKNRGEKQVYNKVDEIMTFLGMSHVADSIIGDEENRGISGGQRKRVNIGMELVAEPSVLFLDEPTSGLDSSTSFEVCRNLRNIAHQQGLTVAAVIHSPSPATFRQFDDFMLLGKGGRIVYMGPREHAKAYFYEIGFTCPPGESESDFFMDVVSGNIPSEYNTQFKPNDLFDYWEQKKRGQLTLAGLPRMTPEMAEQFRRDQLRVIKRETTLRPSETRQFNDYYGYTDAIAAGIADIGRDLYFYVKDIVLELFFFIKGIAFAIFQQPDPVRQTQPMYMQGYYLIKRAFRQVFVLRTLLQDIGLNFAAGLFISVAIQKFQFIGSNPDPMCAYTPRNLSYQCIEPVDQLREAGMFISLGSLFAGISVAGNTFGREKVVYWRDTAGGMSVIPYFFAKFIVDIPRIIVGSAMYSFSLVMFFAYGQAFGALFLIILSLHFYAFALGYALSAVVPYSNYSLYGTGFSLLWALALSGVTPSLWDILPRENYAGYPPAIRWLWDISAPRWAIEAFYVNEVQALPFQEKREPAAHRYNFSNYPVALRNMAAITAIWLFIAILGMKLFNRSKQK